jgi:hypothetical protein
VTVAPRSLAALDREFGVWTRRGLVVWLWVDMSWLAWGIEPAIHWSLPLEWVGFASTRWLFYLAVAVLTLIPSIAYLRSRHRNATYALIALLSVASPIIFLQAAWQYGLESGRISSTRSNRSACTKARWQPLDGLPTTSFASRASAKASALSSSCPARRPVL